MQNKKNDSLVTIKKSPSHSTDNIPDENNHEKLFKDIQLSNSKVIIWQMGSGSSKRNVVETKLKSYPLEAGLLHFELPQDYKVESGVCIYCYSVLGTFLFKSDINEIKDHTLCIQIPTKIKILKGNDVDVLMSMVNINLKDLDKHNESKEIASTPNYFLNINGSIVGPLSGDDVRLKLKTSEANPTSLLLREGTTQWVPLNSSDFKDSIYQSSKMHIVQQAKPLEHPASDEKIYASFGSRFAAYLIDMMILGVSLMVINVIVLFLYLPGRDREPVYDSIVFIVVLVSLIDVPMIMGYNIFLQQKMEGTLGKYILGIRVVDSNFSPITMGQSATRYLFKILGGIPLNAGQIVAAFDEQGRGWHDRRAHTLVVEKDALRVIRTNKSKEESPELLSNHSDKAA